MKKGEEEDENSGEGDVLKYSNNSISGESQRQT